MFLFLIPLMIGFIFNSASAFTAYYSRRFGEQGGRLACIILRDLLGIPVWAAGFGFAVVAPSTQLFNPVLFSSTLAWLMILAGGVIISIGLISIRWRAAAPSIQDTLVVHGIYAHIRHPLYSGMILELVGLFLWVPKVSVLIACMLGFAWALLQARLEEIDLLERLPEYKTYMQQVPRFIPRFW